uniref:Uncharacterized protein n=1 Tax=Rhizophora mucronata TaxID=61149 RepID=A0A2P2JID8_RHIMU
MDMTFIFTYLHVLFHHWYTTLTLQVGDSLTRTIVDLGLKPLYFGLL